MKWKIGHSEDIPWKYRLQGVNAVVPTQIPPPSQLTWSQELGISAAADSQCVSSWALLSVARNCLAQGYAPSVWGNFEGLSQLPSCL